MTYIPAALRRVVVDRAGNCCEYCRLSQEDYAFAFHIEHIIAAKHGGQTIADNLALSCPECNAYKGSDLASLDPATDAPTLLFHPRRHLWTEHFRLVDARIEGLTPEGV